MNFSPQQRRNLLALSVVTLGVLLAFWFFLIAPARAKLKQSSEAENSLSQKIAAKKQVIRNAEELKAKFAETSLALGAAEEKMVSGDPYLWIYKMLKDFEVPQKIEFPKIDRPQFVELNLPVNIFYKTISFNVVGAATFHDLGAFLARFENLYPHIHIQHLEMEPVGVSGVNDDKLSFAIEFRALVRPAPVSNKTPPRS